jgi:hypothetical protein
MGILGIIISLLSSGPAIQNLDRIDMKIDYKDGGVLLPVIVSQHLDNTSEVASLIRSKLETYIQFIESGELSQAKYIKVQLNCVKKPDLEAIKVIESFRERFNNIGAELSWKS